MASHIEEAKSGRASCRTCKKTIGKGELRLGLEVPNQFSDSTVQWHHLPCAADKHPAELREALATYTGEVANKAELEATMDKAIQEGHAKPGGFPYADHAPTGRAKCIQCGAAIEKGTIRVAIEREIDTGAMVTKGAGYMHPGCVKAHTFETEGGLEEVVEGVKQHSRMPDAELAAAVAAIEAGEPSPGEN